MNPSVSDAQMEDLVSTIAEHGLQIERAWPVA
jgi:hypothetical protein